MAKIGERERLSSGGGVIYLIANQIDMLYGIITSNGMGGGSDTGSGAGGSIRLDGADIEVGSPTGIPVGHVRVDGGTNNTDGSDGYIAAYYQNSLVINAEDHALNVTTNVTATPEPTVVAVPTIDPATSVWHSRTYNYSNEHPNRITDTTDGDAYKSDAPRARGAGVSTQKRVSNANGNQISRLVDGVTQTLIYNVENRLASVMANGTGESYLYDGDGVRVARVRAGEATYLFMGGMYEVSVEIPSGTVTDSKSYYTAAGQVIAVRDADGLNVILTDHLGSVLGEVDGFGVLVGEQRYLPFGEVRGDVGSNLSVDLSFTGQRSLRGTGLLDYHARQYDPALRSFIQADSIIPNPYGVLDYNRYLYVHANPVRFTDPSGNRITEGCGDLGLESCGGTQAEIDRNIQAENEFRQTTERNKCKAGEELHCSYADNHPLEFTLFIIGGLSIASFGLSSINVSYGEAVSTSFTSACADGNCLNELDYLDELFSTSYRQLQHLYTRHGADFGFSTNWNGSTTPRELIKIIVDHINDSSTEMILGTYRGTTPVMHLFNSSTLINVMFKLDGTLVSGWRLSPVQIINLFRSGNIQ